MTDKLHVATRKGWFELRRSGGNNWQIEKSAFVGVPVSMTLACAAHEVYYAALDHGHFGVKLHRSEDAGKTWKEVSAPRYPKVDGADENAPALKLIWCMEYADDAKVALWAGTIPGGLFYSNDSGESWQLNESLWKYRLDQQWFGGGYEQPGIHSICVHPQQSRHITLAVSCAGTWKSLDGGDTWVNCATGMRAAFMPPEQQFDPNIQDPHRMVQCAAQPDLCWVQHHNGIFNSIDTANRWEEIKDVTPSVFGFTVAVHPRDGNTAWFVPGVKDECRVPVDAKFVVTRTRDGGKTFTTLSNGLPQQNAFDLVYRHGMDIDASGDVLAMGSTTGNLWISHDQGDHWQCVSNHLPPIYAVRFVK